MKALIAFMVGIAGIQGAYAASSLTTVDTVMTCDQGYGDHDFQVGLVYNNGYHVIVVQYDTTGAVVSHNDTAVVATHDGRTLYTDHKTTNLYAYTTPQPELQRADLSVSGVISEEAGKGLYCHNNGTISY